MNKTVTIIGGGLGGLFCGAMLAKEGLQVTVVEKNATVGGGLQSFTRRGCVFDTGMHIVGGMSPDGNVRRICRWLGIDENINLRPVDADYSDEIHFGDKCYYLRTGRQAFVEALVEQFPAMEREINNYVDAIFDIASSVSLFNLHPDDGIIASFSEQMLMPADQFIASLISDPELASLMAYMNPLYGGRKGVTPAYIHVLIAVLYIEGASRFIDGSQQFAEKLADYIRDLGGCVITGDAVATVNVSDRMVTSVTTASGRELVSDLYISAIHPAALMKLVPTEAFTKAYRSRIEAMPNTYSAFSLYIEFKPSTFSYINRSVYCMESSRQIWDFGEPTDNWPRGFLFMTPPSANQGEFAHTALVTAPMLFSEVEQWSNTTTPMRRGAEYEAWKEQMAQRILDKLNALYPGIRDKIEHYYTASPLTIRDYYAAPGGCLAGVAKDAGNIVVTQLPVVTKVRNLLLTGQNNNLHGFCGVPLTAINTAEAILGRNHIINAINQSVPHEN